MNRWMVAITVMLPTLIEIVDTSVVNVSLDHIRGSLSAGIDESTWIITSYLASNAIIIPITAWLSKLFGRKHYLIFSISYLLSVPSCAGPHGIYRVLYFSGSFRVQEAAPFSLFHRPFFWKRFRPISTGWRWRFSVSASCLGRLSALFWEAGLRTTGPGLDILHQRPNWIHFDPDDPLFYRQPPLHGTHQDED